MGEGGKGDGLIHGEMVMLRVDSNECGCGCE